MGAWGEDTFGNDAACDWVGQFLEKPGMAKVWGAINSVLHADDYLDSEPACDCLAACEVLARLQGNWGVRNAYSKVLDTWIEANPLEVPRDLKKAADSAIDRILDADSELLALWDEDGRNATLHDAIDDLRSRVAG